MRENIDVNLQLIALLTGRKIKIYSRCQEIVYLKMLSVHTSEIVILIKSSHSFFDDC